MAGKEKTRKYNKRKQEGIKETKTTEIRNESILNLGQKGKQQEIDKCKGEQRNSSCGHTPSCTSITRYFRKPLDCFDCLLAVPPHAALFAHDYLDC